MSYGGLAHVFQPFFSSRVTGVDGQGPFILLPGALLIAKLAAKSVHPYRVTAKKERGDAF